MISTVTAIKRTEENESRHAPTPAAAPEEELEIPASSMTPAPSMSPLPRLVANRS